MSKVLVETSARHVHVSEKDLETLFGPGYQLTVKKMLSQPGQYACAERVDVVGEKKTLTGVSILGPLRQGNPGGAEPDRRAQHRRKGPHP